MAFCGAEFLLQANLVGTPPVLRHRIQLRPEAELEGVGVGAVLESALGSVPVPR